MVDNIKDLIFSRAGAANSAVRGRIWLNFKLICTLMVVLITCKNEEDPIKTEGAGVLTTFSQLLVYGDFSRRSRAANSAVLDPIWTNFGLVKEVYGSPCYMQN